jgi:hypothetical protein
MLAIGPIFPEQRTFDKHTPLRDRMATLEYGVADLARSLGLTVLGKHHIGTPVSCDVQTGINSAAREFLLRS